MPLSSFHSSGVVFTLSCLLFANAVFEIQRIRIGYAFFSARLCIEICVIYVWFQVTFQHFTTLESNKWALSTESKLNLAFGG